MTGAGFGVYVHWPFCARICPYCDFNVYRDRGEDAARFGAAMVAELEYWARARPGRRLTSLYFGGGTPSLAPPVVIADIVGAADRLWGFETAAEITLETNPTDADIARFEEFRSAGVNRLSLGVQALDDAALQFLGRDHDAAGARRALDRALAVFARVSADLIYARPGQTSGQWADELRAMIAAGARHLSLYQLTIEPGTAFGRAVEKGRWAPAGEDDAATLFDLTQELTAAAGLAAYEISNHAARGEESRHNLNYWRQGDYLGVGPGAHGRVTIDGARLATFSEKDPKAWLARVETQGVGTAETETLNAEQAMIEKFAMGLRMAEGVAMTPEEAQRLAAPIAALAADGLLRRDGARLIATADGRRLLDTALAKLLA